MIDPATGWFEIAELKRDRADYTADLLERVWLNQYPWPTEVICDRGKEFMAEVIDTLKNDYGIVQKTITTRNPQANAMAERAHQTVVQHIEDMTVY
jgi:transposase InsO family protein